LFFVFSPIKISKFKITEINVEFHDIKGGIKKNQDSVQKKYLSEVNLAVFKRPRKMPMD